MAPHPMTEAEIDEERKTELIMEKKLRACRVNIIPRTGGYFKETVIPPPVSKRPPKPTPSPSAVEKATNPIALRYWNQCMDAKTERKAESMSHEKESHASHSPQMPPWVSSESYHVNTQTAAKTKALTPNLPVKVPDITKRVRSESVPRGIQYNNKLTLEPEVIHHDDPSPMVERRGRQEKVEEIRILSTAGTGITRKNQVQEALGNINRFITVDKVKREDALRVANDVQRKISAPTPLTIDTKPYNQIKEDQIKVSKDRSNFQNNSTNRIPKPPQPFKGSLQNLAESNATAKDECRKCKENQTNKDIFPRIKTDTDMAKFIDYLLPQLNPSQKSQLGISLYRQLSSDIKKDLVAEQISLMSAPDLVSVFSKTSNEAVNRAVPVLFPRTNDDVKLDLVVGALPDLAPQLKNEMFQDTDRKVLPESDRVNFAPKINTAEVNIIEKPKKIENNNDHTKNKSSKVSIPEIRIDTADDSNMSEEVGIEYENERFENCTVTKPDIRIDLTDTSMDDESSEDDAKKEWGWEDGEELEYEFYELDLNNAVGTSL